MYFLGLSGERSGVLNVEWVSQYDCHFASTEAKGYELEGGEVEEGRSCEVAEKRRDPRRGKSAVESPPERRTGGAVALVMVE